LNHRSKALVADAYKNVADKQCCALRYRFMSIALAQVLLLLTVGVYRWVHGVDGD
jgi:hypothetical protein